MIKDSFWSDSYIANLDPIEKLLFVYLLTNPLCNIAGIYEIQLRRIAFDTGIDKDMLEKLFSRLEKDGKLIVIDDWIVIVNHIKHQSHTNPNINKGISRIIQELPEKIRDSKGLRGLPHLTLLNLTLPNLTLPNVTKPKTEDVVSVVEETKKEDSLIPEVIKLFEDVDPKNKTYYGNTSQRKACEFLIEEYTFEEVKKRISFLNRSNKQPYFPTITTPCQLRDKWVQLEDAASRTKTQQDTSNVVAF